ncbi:nitrogen regulation protein NR(I) [Haliea sp.]|jgi:two-component system nitrogen regulation response regulator GlnG|uniref:nitrogen regulation protein NR(I) n=1 Tax=Haliea TaxID=475794 RepID=UPI000C40B2A1|nr:nitrogen regulation protein NR(I) [Haliea sp.]HBM84148.1 nitrogen regulation protein NR(I) [Halieaceae bacterium]MAD63766.1 nitrogen regulation protein NR(I) [Haliea sp.]MAY92127.1 nitrogen regulation protein NR(I) [Haliea sp.]MBK42051.1 nitrogen regulation protein NR(I) [Haliea sp.]MBP70157.1 nitrogen regulation protein NR(I) [Haliea sp.]|tara:strand:+ start:7006 stop:8415 length:1410 start_codon:yes stop_codon:yes gene_type:complete
MQRHAKVWVVDDDSSIRWVLERALSQAGIDNESFSDGDQLIERMLSERPDVIISDIRMPGIDGLDLLTRINDEHPELPVIITTAHSDLESAVASYQRGAFEYLPKPFDIDEVVAITERALAQAREKRGEMTLPEALPETEIIGEAPAMQEVFRAIGRLAQSNITVLINGESGTGKELVARALHRHSPRAQRPFIALNMAAIPRDLMESELFGHEKGAFTGANSKREGRFEQANGGTLFLDEIGDMPAETQTRLLRVLADGEFYRVGGHTSVKVDVRIIAATHQDLEERVQRGDFREDLFHRLNVIRIHIPRLAERREDIPRLMKFFFRKAAEELGGEPKILLPDTERFLVALAWPGNVRQLENTCRWLTVMASGREIHLRDLPPELGKVATPVADGTSSQWNEQLGQWARKELQQGKHHILRQAVPMFERAMIEVALAQTQGRKRDAAELLGWGRNTLTRKMKDLDMSD